MALLIRSDDGWMRRSGLRLDYVDYHMGTVLRAPEFREIAERLAHVTLITHRQLIEKAGLNSMRRPEGR